MFPVTLTRLIVMITFCRDTLQGSPDPLRETEVSGLEQGTSHLYEKHVRTEASCRQWAEWHLLALHRWISSICPCQVRTSGHQTLRQCLSHLNNKIHFSINMVKFIIMNICSVGNHGVPHMCHPQFHPIPPLSTLHPQMCEIVCSEYRPGTQAGSQTGGYLCFDVLLPNDLHHDMLYRLSWSVWEWPDLDPHIVISYTVCGRNLVGLILSQLTAQS